MDPNELTWQPVAAEGAPMAPTPELTPQPAPDAEAGTTPNPGPSPRGGMRRLIGSVVLAAGLLGVGGASVVLAASPSPSAPTSPSVQQPAGGGTHHAPNGAAPGDCPNHGSGTAGGSGSSSGSSSAAPTTSG